MGGRGGVPPQGAWGGASPPISANRFTKQLYIRRLRHAIAASIASAIGSAGGPRPDVAHPQPGASGGAAVSRGGAASGAVPISMQRPS